MERSFLPTCGVSDTELCRRSDILERGLDLPARTVVEAASELGWPLAAGFQLARRLKQTQPHRQNNDPASVTLAAFAASSERKIEEADALSALAASKALGADKLWARGLRFDIELTTGRIDKAAATHDETRWLMKKTGCVPLQSVLERPRLFIAKKRFEAAIEDLLAIDRRLPLEQATLAHRTPQRFLLEASLGLGNFRQAEIHQVLAYRFGRRVALPWTNDAGLLRHILNETLLVERLYPEHRRAQSNHLESTVAFAKQYHLFVGDLALACAALLWRQGRFDKAECMAKKGIEDWESSKSDELWRTLHAGHRALLGAIHALTLLKQRDLLNAELEGTLAGRFVEENHDPAVAMRIAETRARIQGACGDRFTEEALRLDAEEASRKVWRHSLQTGDLVWTLF